ncbi:MAG: ACP phosphodiesterase [Verrucomicrobiales bacterium]|nr:ACP phosphodiesterase [Verrucomicrobiales bacterium]
MRRQQIAYWHALPRNLNLLAHLHLSHGCSPDTLTGNVMADYLGRYEPVDQMSESMQERLMPGIRLHREIDQFTDQHSVVARARNHISPDRRRLGGIILDIAFDYYLTRHWEKFSTEKRENTISRGYATIAMVASTGLSKKTETLISKMRMGDWLTAYGTLEGQALTFRRVSRVSPAVANLRGAEEEIVANDSVFEQCFLEFYPDLIERASKVLDEESA